MRRRPGGAKILPRESDILFRVAELMDQVKESWPVSNRWRMARPIGGAARRRNPGIDSFRYYAGSVRRIYGETIPVDGPFLNYTLREPVGVVGAIVPWNYPVCIATWKIAPALACGCSVILKPSELTPLDNSKMAEIFIRSRHPRRGSERNHRIR